MPTNNQRDQYRRFVHFAAGVPPPNIDTGPLLDTYERWLREGLNPGLTPYRENEWWDAMGLDRWPLRVLYEIPRKPLFDEQVLEETATTFTRRRSDGSIFQDSKGSHRSIPHEIRPAITSRAEWERYKEWLQLEAPLPAASEPAVAEMFRQAREADYPVWVGNCSMVGNVRNLLGFEAFAMMAYDDYDLLEDMIEAQCRAAEWQVRLFGENQVPLDGVHFWEDICFKNGPIMNPEHFRALAVPRYQRIADLARSYGYDMISVDSDGNINALLDEWLAGGVNLIWPLEVQAGMDINALQAKVGRRTAFIGNIHKHRLVGGEKEIAAELERVRPAVERGGYIPTLDHNCPSDVSFDNYLTYLRFRHEILGLGRGGPDPARVR